MWPKCCFSQLPPFQPVSFLGFSQNFPVWKQIHVWIPWESVLNSSSFCSWAIFGLFFHSSGKKDKMRWWFGNLSLKFLDVESWENGNRTWEVKSLRRRSGRKEKWDIHLWDVPVDASMSGILVMEHHLDLAWKTGRWEAAAPPQFSLLAISRSCFRGWKEKEWIKNSVISAGRALLQAPAGINYLSQQLWHCSEKSTH